VRKSVGKDTVKKVKISYLQHFFFFKKQISLIFALKLIEIINEQ